MLVSSVMKRFAYFATALVILLAALFAYVNRGSIRDTLNVWTKPKLPIAQEYTSSTGETSKQNTENVKEAPQKVDAEIQPVAVSDTLVWKGALPAEVNLAVPFLLQAPHQNWVEPFEDACEEASLIMVDAFYQGRHTNFAADEGEAALLKTVAYEDSIYGHNKNTNTREVARTAENYFGYHNVIIRKITSASDMKAVLANGYPIIVPADGRALENPNFRNGGPDYHMLVVKGYTKDGLWITNDPGTRNGPDYLYKQDVLLNAIHSFVEGNMEAGAKEIIVVLPNS